MTTPSIPQAPRPHTSRSQWGRGIVLLAALVIAVVAVRWSGPLPGGRVEIDRTEVRTENGLLYRTGQTNPFSGFMVERYESGALRSRSGIHNGRLEGMSEGWHTNGQMQVRESFRVGIAEGLRTKWHENGQKLSEVPIVNGKLHGIFRRWHENGQLAEEIPMTAGEAHGLARSYYESGNPKAQVTLEHGKPVKQLYWQDGEAAVAVATGKS